MQSLRTATLLSRDNNGGAAPTPLETAASSHHMTAAACRDHRWGAAAGAQQYLVGYRSRQQQLQIHAFLASNSATIIAFVPDDTWVVVATPAVAAQLSAQFPDSLVVDYEPSCKLAPRWADVLGAISAGAADPNPASGSSGGASEPSGSLSAASDQGPKLLLPTDCHLGGGLEGGGSDDPTSAAAHARTAAVAAAARARDAAQHQRALGGLKTQASRGGSASLHLIAVTLHTATPTKGVVKAAVADWYAPLSQALAAAGWLSSATASEYDLSSSEHAHTRARHHQQTSARTLTTTGSSSGSTSSSGSSSSSSSSSGESDGISGESDAISSGGGTAGSSSSRSGRTLFSDPVTCRPSLTVAGAGTLHVAVCASDLAVALTWLQLQPAVSWLQPVYKVVTHNNALSSVLCQAGAESAAAIAAPSTPAYHPLWSAGLLGQNQVIGIGDTGLNTDSCFFGDLANPNPSAHTLTTTDAEGNPVLVYNSTAHRKLRQYYSFAGGLGGACGANASVGGTRCVHALRGGGRRALQRHRTLRGSAAGGRLLWGSISRWPPTPPGFIGDLGHHGTHTAGSLAGALVNASAAAAATSQGYYAPSDAGGMAPAAKVAHCHLETDASRAMAQLFLPQDLSAHYLQINYNVGARVNSDSWGTVE
ncbi:MAG: hypothetical protein WDW36_008386 [Sanguina aurantia]